VPLFTALLPPADALAALAAELDRVEAGGVARDGLRWYGRDLWHITLGFYGERTDENAETAWLAEALAGHPAPTVRLAGAGTFAGVLWAGVYGDRLTELATVAGAGRDGRAYLPHLTLARFPPESPERAKEWEAGLGRYSGEAWRPDEVALLRSDREGGGEPRHRVLRRFPLDGRPGDRRP
jgi:2'-5' RNA ligase